MHFFVPVWKRTKLFGRTKNMDVKVTFSLTQYSSYSAIKFRFNLQIFPINTPNNRQRPFLCYCWSEVRNTQPKCSPINSSESLILTQLTPLVPIVRLNPPTMVLSRKCGSPDWFEAQAGSHSAGYFKMTECAFWRDASHFPVHKQDGSCNLARNNGLG